MSPKKFLHFSGAQGLFTLRCAICKPYKYIVLNGVSKVFQGGFKNISSMLDRCLMCNYECFMGVFNIVSRVFQRCFKDFLKLFNPISYGSYGWVWGGGTALGDLPQNIREGVCSTLLSGIYW